MRKYRKEHRQCVVDPKQFFGYIRLPFAEIIYGQKIDNLLLRIPSLRAEQRGYALLNGNCYENSMDVLIRDFQKRIQGPVLRSAFQLLIGEFLKRRIQTVGFPESVCFVLKYG